MDNLFLTNQIWNDSEEEGQFWCWKQKKSSAIRATWSKCCGIFNLSSMPAILRGIHYTWRSGRIGDIRKYLQKNRVVYNYAHCRLLEKKNLMFSIGEDDSLKDDMPEVKEK